VKETAFTSGEKRDDPDKGEIKKLASGMLFWVAAVNTVRPICYEEYGSKCYLYI
jgi:hypothetical protein